MTPQQDDLPAQGPLAPPLGPGVDSPPVAEPTSPVAPPAPKPSQ